MQPPPALNAALGFDIAPLVRRAGRRRNSTSTRNALAVKVLLRVRWTAAQTGFVES